MQAFLSSALKWKIYYFIIDYNGSCDFINAWLYVEVLFLSFMGDFIRKNIKFWFLEVFSASIKINFLTLIDILMLASLVFIIHHLHGGFKSDFSTIWKYLVLTIYHCLVISVEMVEKSSSLFCWCHYIFITFSIIKLSLYIVYFIVSDALFTVGQLFFRCSSHIPSFTCKHSHGDSRQRILLCLK